MPEKHHPGEHLSMDARRREQPGSQKCARRARYGQKRPTCSRALVTGDRPGPRSSPGSAYSAARTRPAPGRFAIAVNHLLDRRKSRVEALDLSCDSFTADLLDGLCDGSEGHDSILAEEVKLGCTLAMLTFPGSHRSRRIHPR